MLHDSANSTASSYRVPFGPWKSLDTSSSIMPHNPCVLPMKSLFGPNKTFMYWRRITALYRTSMVRVVPKSDNNIVNLMYIQCGKNNHCDFVSNGSVHVGRSRKCSPIRVRRKILQAVMSKRGGNVFCFGYFQVKELNNAVGCHPPLLLTTDKYPRQKGILALFHDILYAHLHSSDWLRGSHMMRLLLKYL